MTFQDRSHAGHTLGERLESTVSGDAIVCGIPRGGAVVAAQAAIAAGLRYECLVVCKIGMPCFPEVTLGAIDEDGDVLFDPATQLTRVEVSRVGGSLLDRLRQQVTTCRGERTVAALNDQTAIVITDYVSDAIVSLAALKLARKRGAARVVLATPAITRDLESELRGEFDDVIALETPTVIAHASDVYRDASEPTDQEISTNLKEAWDAVP